MSDAVAGVKCETCGTEAMKGPGLRRLGEYKGVSSPPHCDSVTISAHHSPSAVPLGLGVGDRGLAYVRLLNATGTVRGEPHLDFAPHLPDSLALRALPRMTRAT